MPELCRVGICGFDPMLVKGYTAQNMRAIWWHISDELFEEFDMKPGMKVSGKILKLYDGKDGQEFSAPNEKFFCPSHTFFISETPFLGISVFFSILIFSLSLSNSFSIIERR